LTLAVLLLTGCGGAPADQQGEIVGITAKIPFQEVQSGNHRNMEYIGTIKVLLPDEGVVIANCNEEFLSDIAEALVFIDDQFTYQLQESVFSFSDGGFIATITINLDNLEEPQYVLLALNEDDVWEVTEVIK